MTTGVTYSRIYPNTTWVSPGRSDLVVATRDPREFPFDADSVWNLGFGSDATFESNTGGNATNQFLTTGASVGWAVNSATWSVSVGRAKLTDPIRHVTCTTTTDTWDIRIPNSLTATGGSDGWVTVIDETGETAREFYAAVKNADGSWTTRYPLVVTDLRGHGVKDGRRASLTPQMAGLILASQLATMGPTHALSLAVPLACLKPTPTSGDGDNIGANSSGGGYVWPAHGADNQANIPYNPAGLTAMGSVWGIPPSVNLAGLGLATPEGRWLGRCLQDNGAVVVAQAGTMSLAIEPLANQTRVTALRPDWKILGPQLRRLTNHRGGSLNANREPLDPTVTLGGGVRRPARLADLS